MVFYDEKDYYLALLDLGNTQYHEKDWLSNNFDMYKSTLNWPQNPAAISRTNLVDDTLRKKFHKEYGLILSRNSHYFDNHNRTLNFLLF